MGKKMSIIKGRLYSSLIYPAAVLLLMSGCAAGTATNVATGETRAPITVQQSDTSPGVQQNKDDAWKSVSDAAMPAPQVKVAAQPAAAKPAVTEAVKDITPSEPRIFFEPSKSNINEVLGIDFTLAENGKSRLIVTTAKKTSYDLDRKDEKTLILKIHDSTIANPLLMRQIDTTQFQSVLEGIKQVYSSQKKEVDLILSLREIVPFNINLTDSGINMDFGQTAVKVAEKKIIPLDLAETETSTLSVKSDTSAESVMSAEPQADSSAAKAEGKRYKGEKMYLDFVDTDITYILKLINDVSGKNIIWDPAIAGQKVSMVLKDIPWDQALSLIVENYNLGMWDENNVIMVTTKDKYNQKVAEREAAEAKKKAEQNKVDEVKRTEIIKVSYTNASEVAAHISANVFGQAATFSTGSSKASSTTTSSKSSSLAGNLSATGSSSDVGAKYLTIDEKSNSIIITATATQIELAKKIAKEVDRPSSQIQIKARVVTATKKFTRNLGVIWNAPGTNATGTFGSNTWTGAFSTNNLADNWSNGSVVNFATITGSIGNLSLDASLALAEKDGDIQTLAEPKILTRNGTTAVIRSGETIITAPTENVESKTINADLSLTITPTAFADSEYILVQTAITDDQIVTSSQLITKSITTDLIVRNGETIVIGGILKETEDDYDSGVPVLKDIPILGWLFKNNYKMKEQSELLIFLTPTIVPSPVNVGE